MYNYETQKQNLFTDEGQRMFLKIRDRVNTMLITCGAFRLQEAIRIGGTGDSWDMLACVDRLVELKEIREISRPGCSGQHRVFVSSGLE